MAWKAERRATHGMQMGQKLASIYRSRVSSRRIIISRNWSRENSLLVSRTDALVFYSVVIVRCGEGERERNYRWNFARLRNLISINRNRNGKILFVLLSIRNVFIYSENTYLEISYDSSICSIKKSLRSSRIIFPSFFSTIIPEFTFLYFILRKKSISRIVCQNLAILGIISRFARKLAAGLIKDKNDFFRGGATPVSFQPGGKGVNCNPSEFLCEP